jgi:hypothetical protein
MRKLLLSQVALAKSAPTRARRVQAAVAAAREKAGASG